MSSISDNSVFFLFHLALPWTLKGTSTLQSVLLTSKSFHLRGPTLDHMVCDPSGMEIDAEGYSLVTEWAGHYHLSIFDPQGHKIHTVHTYINPDAKSGSLYVTIHCEV